MLGFSFLRNGTKHNNFVYDNLKIDLFIDILLVRGSRVVEKNAVVVFDLFHKSGPANKQHTYQSIIYKASCIFSYNLHSNSPANQLKICIKKE